MALSKRFSIFAAATLSLTLGAKLAFVAGVGTPDDETIAIAMAPLFEGQGFLSAGVVDFAGRPALLVSREACLLYVVPVAPQGWSEATVRHAIGPDQSLWFAFAGSVREDTQERYRPLLIYYINKSMAYMRFSPGYSPVLALVGSRACQIDRLDWSRIPTVPFKEFAVDYMSSAETGSYGSFSASER